MDGRRAHRTVKKEADSSMTVRFGWSSLPNEITSLLDVPVHSTAVQELFREAMNQRNQPCPCNSGKKYKKCCGSEALLSVKRREAEARQLEAVRARRDERLREQEEARRANPGAHRYERSPMSLVLAAAVLGMGGGWCGMGGVRRRRR
jgi:ABC-type uncharacterized transport system involved in gliding motility auxiliary subunit